METADDSCVLGGKSFYGVGWRNSFSSSVGLCVCCLSHDSHLAGCSDHLSGLVVGAPTNNRLDPTSCPELISETATNQIVSIKKTLGDVTAEFSQQ